MSGNQIHDSHIYLCPLAEIYRNLNLSYQTLNESLKLSFNFNFSLSFDEQTSGYWVILAVISLRAAAAERDADLTRIIFSLNSFYLF